MDGSGPFLISPRDLYATGGTNSGPLIIDVRRRAGFDGDSRMIAGAIRRDPEQVQEWRGRLPAERLVVVYCMHGHEVSQNTARALRDAGIDARYLEDGIAGWVEEGLPMRSKARTGGPVWVTRERPKIDRIACPWLIRRFIDPEARFLYVPTEKVFAVAKETGATAYDIPGAEPFSHEGELCSFDLFLRVYELADPALDTLAVIVRGADTDRLALAPQAPGLLAITLGLSANFPADHAMLEQGMVIYDALYTWCRSLQGETHGWNPNLGR
jgi:rhodanese-related sulfurtransferase